MEANNRFTKDDSKRSQRWGSGRQIPVSENLTRKRPLIVIVAP